MYSASLNFYNRLLNEDIFTGETFDLDNESLNITSLKSIWVNFLDCTFNCEILNFKNITDDNLNLQFENCTFNCNVTFSDCTFESLAFKNTNAIKSLEINNLKLHNLVFSNDFNVERPELTSEFTIRKSNIDFLLFEKLNHIQGRFHFFRNKFGEKNGSSSFQNSTITNVLFGKNIFFNFTSFKTVTFKSTKEYLKPVGSAFEFPGFYSNTFDKISFTESNFIDTFQFDNCDFLRTTWFEECKNLTNSKLRFVACEFKGFSLFNKSKINFLDIDRCTFDKSSSFTDAEFNTLKLFEVKFGGGAYFDEMKINKVLDKSYLKAKNEKILEWKRTLRAIKQELQKTENKIDFNRFRSYELAAHYKELSLWRNFKDTSILFTTKISTDFGSNWLKGLRFTLISGFTAFSLFFIFENTRLTFDLNNWQDFIYGYFRFFLITDFKNEYYRYGESVLKFNSIFSLFPFIIGKIVIAFGIYEMIQSFRKFKA